MGLNKSLCFFFISSGTETQVLNHSLNVKKYLFIPLDIHFFERKTFLQITFDVLISVAYYPCNNITCTDTFSSITRNEFSELLNFSVNVSLSFPPSIRSFIMDHKVNFVLFKKVIGEYPRTGTDDFIHPFAMFNDFTSFEIGL